MLPRLPTAGQDYPQSAVPATEARASIAEGSREDPDLVAKRQVLDGKLAPRLQRRLGAPKDDPNQAQHAPDGTHATPRCSRPSAPDKVFGYDTHPGSIAATDFFTV